MELNYEQLRILWASASPNARTGYGSQTEQTVGRLVQKGYDITCLSGGGSLQWSGETTHYVSLDGTMYPIKVLPTHGESSGINLWHEYQAAHNINLFISLWDSFSIHQYTQLNFPAIHYIPIDAPFTEVMYHHMHRAYFILAMSEYGYLELLKWYPPRKIGYIPHGINTNFFKPHTKAQQARYKTQLGLKSDDFLMLTVAANVGERKELPLLLYAFSRFAKKYPNTYLYLFTNFTAKYPIGFDLVAYANALGIGNRLLWPKFDTMRNPMSDEIMVGIYNASDLYITAAMGEGFGLPILSSQACGTPVLAFNHSTTPELVKGHGYIAKPIPLDQYQNVPVWIPNLQTYPVGNIDSFLHEMKRAYTNSQERLDYGIKAREFSLKYDWKEIIPRWVNLLNRFQDEITIREEIKACF